MLLALLAVGYSSGPASARAVPDGYVGVNAQYLFPFFPPWEVDAHLDAMRLGGIETVRTDAFWHEVEPNAPVDGVHEYHWEKLDRQVGALARHGIRWLPIIDYSADWATSVPGRTTAPPASFSLYADYARAVARRYGRGGDFWRQHPDLPAVPVISYEIWNEPNHPGFWLPQPDAAAYADLYLTTRAAIRSVDGDAQAIVGGLTGAAPHTFLAEMYAARPSLLGRVDAVGIHPYAGDVDGVVALIAAMRRTLDERGEAAVPIDVTELGWSTTGGDSFLEASDAERGERLAWLAEHLSQSDCGVERFMPHTWVTGERDPANGDDWFGIYHPDATPTASGRAYLDAAHRLAARPVLETREPLCGRAADAPAVQVTQLEPRSDRAPAAPAAPAGSAAPAAAHDAAPTTAQPRADTRRRSSGRRRGARRCRRAAARARSAGRARSSRVRAGDHRRRTGRRRCARLRNRR